MATPTATPSPTSSPTSTTTPTHVPDPKTAVISGYVWQDTNGDGIQQSGEAAIIVQKVALVRVGCINAEPADGKSTKTDLIGDYRFKNLSAGTYCVAVDRPSTCGLHSILTTTENVHLTLIGDGFEIQLEAGQSVGVIFGYSKNNC